MAIRSIVAATSAEVNSVPFCHMTPWRSWNVHTDPSSFGDHDDARPVSAEMLPSSPSPTRCSKLWLTMLYVEKSSMATGSNPPASGIAVSPTINSPPVAVLEPPPVAVVAVVPPLSAAVVPDPPSSPPQAAITVLMKGSDKPMMVPRLTKSRRLILFWA